MIAELNCRRSVGPTTPPSDVASPRTTAVAAGRGPAPETRTVAQRSGSEPHTDRWRRSPARGLEEMSSSFAKFGYNAVIESLGFGPTQHDSCKCDGIDHRRQLCR